MRNLKNLKKIFYSLGYITYILVKIGVLYKKSLFIRLIDLEGPAKQRIFNPESSQNMPDFL
jgi:hypothetical protein